MGFGLAGGMTPLPNESSSYWGGYGGSIIIIDMEIRATYSYVMNKMGPGIEGSARTDRYFRLIYDALG